MSPSAAKPRGSRRRLVWERSVFFAGFPSLSIGEFTRRLRLGILLAAAEIFDLGPQRFGPLLTQLGVVRHGGHYRFEELFSSSMWA
ncbi:MAG: hypothetical protein JWR13_5906 [Mycobacterium sp.]|nr:hypothetical protein [Mycobacterium sp.]MDT5311562.1 hypothetical protein [Mycobacterium sp.]